MRYGLATWIDAHGEKTVITPRYEQGQIVIAVSQMCARDYQRYHDVPAERIRLVYHGTDNQRFSPAHRDRWREEMGPDRFAFTAGEAGNEARFILLNSLLVRENLAGKAPHPVAERLLRNMLMFAQPR